MLIIATVGPSTKEKRILKEILQCGANALRFNFSHGDVKGFNEIIKDARSIEKNIHIIQDLSGSKIRVSDKLPYIIKIYNGEEVIFCGEDKYQENGYKLSNDNRKIIPLNISSILLQDQGLIEISMKDKTMLFKIKLISKLGIKAEVLRGGVVRAGKGCNIKGFSRSKLELSDKDIQAIKWGVDNEVDVICQSFVEGKSDVVRVKNKIKEINFNNKVPKIWAKIETSLGVENIEEIVKLVDGIIIGRGDLVPETSLVDAPIYQERVFRALKGTDKELVVGTHLLNSMKNGKNPELPEVESIYNHIKSGVTGFLLAGETSVGKAPIRTVEFMKELLDSYNN